MDWTNSPYLTAQVTLAPEQPKRTSRPRRCARACCKSQPEVAALLPNIPEGAVAFLEQVQDNRQLVYIIAVNIRMEIEAGAAAFSRRTRSTKRCGC